MIEVEQSRRAEVRSRGILKDVMSHSEGHR